MASYQCPLCGRQMDRDLILFLDHTNEHIIERIKVSHPEWVAENGVCKPCMDYYKGEIAGAASNMGPMEQRKRRVMGIVSLGLGLGLGFYLILSGSPHALRLILFVPLFFGMFGFLQAREKTCSVLAEMGSRNMDSGFEKIQDASTLEALKKRGRKILLKSALAAALATLLLLFI